jgi:hypothetical protein
VAAGLPPFIVEAVLSIQDMWSIGGFDMTTGDVERLAGRPPRSFEVCFELRSSRSSRGIIMQR